MHLTRTIDQKSYFCKVLGVEYSVNKIDFGSRRVTVDLVLFIQPSVAVAVTRSTCRVVYTGSHTPLSLYSGVSSNRDVFVKDRLDMYSIWIGTCVGMVGLHAGGALRVNCGRADAQTYT